MKISDVVIQKLSLEFGESEAKVMVVIAEKVTVAFGALQTAIVDHYAEKIADLIRCNEGIDASDLDFVQIGSNWAITPKKRESIVVELKEFSRDIEPHCDKPGNNFLRNKGYFNYYAEQYDRSKRKKSSHK